MAFFRQVKLLLWKNFVLQRRKICVSIFEIFFPVFFAVIFMLIRRLAKPEDILQPTYYSYNQIDLSYTCEIGYTPDHPVLQSVMARAVGDIQTYSCGNRSTVQIKPFATEAEMVDYYKINSDQMRLSVVFHGSQGTNLSKSITYVIRPSNSGYGGLEWHTKDTFPFFQMGPRDSFNPDYVYTGVLGLQTLVGDSLIEQWSRKNDSIDYQYQRMPYPPYRTDGMVQVMETMIPAFIMLSFLLPVIQYTKSIVYEKERKLKESMKLMGLMPSAHWTAWFLTCMIFMVITMVIYTIFLGVSFSDNGPAIGNADASLFFVFMLAYAAAIVSFCFMISSMVQKANIAAVIGGLVFFGIYIPYIFLNLRYEIMTYSQKMALGLLLNSAMALGMKVLGQFLATGEGLSWDNIHKPATLDDNFSFLDALGMLLIDTCIHLVITWYLDNVRPGEFGVPKPFYFPFTRSYWCGPSSTLHGIDDFTDIDEKHFEHDPQGMNAGISILRLRKEFGNKIAVNNISLKMYEGQITVLLGHNGAGKTTTMFMLTGFLPPTSGKAIIQGMDIRTDMDTIRRDLGLCPQHNILFDTMTVQEHLEFFAELKGCPSSRVKEEVETIVKEVGLETKRHARSQTLSGGQKRKLSVGIALINGSKVVILDEPTSGMDPAARRQTWDVLQRNRAGRTILLTTHFMDEADLLGDRIAIMAEGVVKCCGTSMFLKKLYGTGYHLVLVKSPTCLVDKVTAVIQQHISTATFESEVNTELSYLLPDDRSADFPELFRRLESRKEELGIGGFGTTATTMEEVFLKVGENASMEDDGVGNGAPNVPLRSADGFKNHAYEDGAPRKGNQIPVSDEHSILNAPGAMPDYSIEDSSGILSFNHGYSKLTGMQLLMSHLRAMLTKKVLHSWRNRLITLLQIILPVVCSVFALSVDFVPPEEDQVTLYFNLNPFGRTFIPFSNGSRPTVTTNSLAEAYATQFGGSQALEKVDLVNKWDNMSHYFLQRAKDLGTASYNKEVVVGAQLDQDNTGSLLARTFYNGQPYHALPISMIYMLNGLAEHFAGSGHTLVSGLNVMPKNQNEGAEFTQAMASLQGFVIGMIMSFGMAFLTSSFVYLVVKERQVGAKHLQEVSGVGPGIFWGGNFLWDFCNYFIPSLALLVVFGAFSPAAYTDDGRLAIILLILLLYGWSVLPFMYAFSFLFSSAPTALVVAIIYNVFSGTVTTMVVNILIALNLTNVSDPINWVFHVLSPNHCFGITFMQMTINYQFLDTCTNQLNYKVRCYLEPGPCCKHIGMGCAHDSTCFDFSSNFLAMEYPGIGRALLFMWLQGFIFMGLTMLIEYHVPQRLIYYIRGRSASTSNIGDMPLGFINGVRGVPEDSDVAEERQRINSTPVSTLCQTDSLLLMNLYKQYGQLVAVNHLSVGVTDQECFGLLGQNGAGKTTTFKMLTGLEMMDGGNAYVKGLDIKNNLKQVQANLGYCPQFDALHDQLTGRETLNMYARLRGVPSDSMDTVVSSLIDALLLRPHADKLTSAYSGGTKRKLSTAISLVGDPAFILLDEPSSGMDPAARRHLWNVLSQVRASGRTLVLTSHSMEECDALCTRIAIMVNAGFVCLGSPQHLKTKFGQGYTLVAKLDSNDINNGYGGEEAKQRLVAFIQSTIPSARVFDDHQSYVHLQVPDSNVHLADVFTLMERAKHEMQVQDYTVHMTTLEQVFLAFTRRQMPPRDESRKSCLKKFCCCCC